MKEILSEGVVDAYWQERKKIYEDSGGGEIYSPVKNYISVMFADSKISVLVKDKLFKQIVDALNTGERVVVKLVVERES